MQGKSRDEMKKPLITTVKQDVETWTQGKQWLFSCYSPAKETECVPGMSDVSPKICCSYENLSAE